jgi:cobaltochelatase CobT
MAADRTRDQSPTEPLKRAVTVTMRAIARAPELEVAFASDRPGLSGGRARLPEPPRRPNPRDVAVLRGLGDSIALRLACHDAKLHRTLSPEGRAARAVYDAVEQARCEAIGARRMAGVANNLNAMVEDRYHRGNYADVSDRADAPLEDAVALLVRERLTGQAPPAAAAKLVDIWRDFIEDKGHGALDRLSRSLEDQRGFATVVRDLLTSLDMGEELGDQSEDDDEAGENDDKSDTNADESEAQSGESESAEAAAAEESEAGAVEEQEGEAEGAEAVEREAQEDDGADPREAGETPRNDFPFSNRRPEIDYKVYTTKFDETVRAEDLCDADELERLRAFLDKQIAQPAGRRCAARQPPAA